MRRRDSARGIAAVCVGGGHGQAVMLGTELVVI
jgi:acetyl-CoA acetyltransferase